MPGKLGTYHSAGLAFLLIAGGMTDGMAKIYEELGVGALKNHFLLYTFIVAFVMCVAVRLLKKQGLTKADLVFWASNRHFQLQFGVVLIAFAVLDSGDDCLSDV